MSKEHKYWYLFKIFFKIGLFSFGGGFAMMTMIERSLVDEKNLLTHNRMMNIFSVCSAMPGSLALNVSTLTGFTLYGIRGAIVAMIGNLIPATVIVIGLVAFISAVENEPLFLAVMRGISPVVVGLIAGAAYRVSKRALKNIWCWGLMLTGVALLVFAPGVSTIYVVLGGIVLGLILAFIPLKELPKSTQEDLKTKERS